MTTPPSGPLETSPEQPQDSIVFVDKYQNYTITPQGGTFYLLPQTYAQAVVVSGGGDTLTLDGQIKIGTEGATQKIPSKVLSDISGSSGILQAGRPNRSGSKAHLVVNGSVEFRNLDNTEGSNYLIAVADNSSIQTGNVSVIGVSNRTTGDGDLFRVYSGGTLKTGTVDVQNSSGKSIFFLGGVSAEIGGLTVSSGTYQSAVDLRNGSFQSSGPIQINGQENDLAFSEGVILFSQNTDFIVESGVTIANVKAGNSVFKSYGHLGGSDTSDGVISINGDLNVDNVELTGSGNSIGSSRYVEFVDLENKDIQKLKNISIQNSRHTGQASSSSARTEFTAVRIDAGQIQSVKLDGIRIDNVSTVSNYEAVAIALLASQNNATPFTLTNVEVSNFTAENAGKQIFGLTNSIFTQSGSQASAETSSININGVSGKADTNGIYWLQKTEDTTLTAQSIVVQNIDSQEGRAYGINTTATLNVVQNLTISDIESHDGMAAALSVKGGTVNAGSISLSDVRSNKLAVALNADSGARVSLTNAFLTTQKKDDELKYRGFFDEASDPEDTNTLSSIAVRSVGGAQVQLTSETAPLTIAGGIVAGRGTSSSSAKGGHIEITAGEGSKIYGDLYAGNGGTLDLTLNEGSRLEGQIDDYHELKNMKDKVFRNSLFRDENGDELEVREAGRAELQLNGGTWTARGQNFVDTVSFGEKAGFIDLSKNENSSASIRQLTGNGRFVMRLGAYSESGDIQSDMLYIQDVEAGSRQTIYAKLGEGVALENLTNLRFATVKHNASEDLFEVRVEDQGVFNLTADVRQEDYRIGDEDNRRFNGQGDGRGEYKPGEDAVDAVFGSSSTRTLATGANEDTSKNYFIAGFGGGSVSDAGETVLATANATYWNAVIVDRFNQRYGDRIHDGSQHGVWARVKHEHIGTNAGVGDFGSDNTTYQFGYDYSKTTENGRMIWGGALDYMQGRTDFDNINGDGGTDRLGGLFYATYLAESGAYGDLVLRAGRLSADYDMRTPSGKEVQADYDHWMYGVSFEAGHQLDNASGWFAEPQLQLQYTRITEGNYRNVQTKVEQDAIDSLISRVGCRVGKFLSDDKATLGYFKADVMREWMGEQGIRVFDATTAAKGADVSISNHGTWFDVGGGFQAAVTQDLYAYGDVEYRFGNDFDKTWIVNVGAKYRF